MASGKKEKTAKENKDFTRKAYDAVRQMLFYNEILPGQKIKYKDLAARIGVSMTPVIQAMKWLEFRNIVRHEPNRGYYINEVSRKEIREVYDTRLLIEVSLVPEIIRKVDERGLESIRAAYKDWAAAVDRDQYHRRMLTDMGFHMGLASLSGCRIQLKMLHELFDVLLLRYSRNLFFLSVMDSSLKEHEEILSCLERKDEAGLRETLSFHVSTVRDHILEGMARMENEDRDAFPGRFDY